MKEEKDLKYMYFVGTSKFIKQFDTKNGPAMKFSLCVWRGNGNNHKPFDFYNVVCWNNNSHAFKYLEEEDELLIKGYTTTYTNKEGEEKIQITAEDILSIKEIPFNKLVQEVEQNQKDLKKSNISNFEDDEIPF